MIKKNKNRNPKFKFGDNVRISKYKNISTEDYVPNWSEEVFVIKKIKNTVPWTYVISYLNREEIVETFYQKEFQEKNQKEFRIEKVRKRKDNKLYAESKSYDSSIDKKIHNINEWIFSTIEIF